MVQENHGLCQQWLQYILSPECETAVIQTSGFSSNDMDLPIRQKSVFNTLPEKNRYYIATTTRIFRICLMDGCLPIMQLTVSTEGKTIVITVCSL